jgi:hypothetical protein
MVLTDQQLYSVQMPLLTYEITWNIWYKTTDSPTVNGFYILMMT